MTIKEHMEAEAIRRVAQGTKGGKFICKKQDIKRVKGLVRLNEMAGQADQELSGGIAKRYAEWIQKAA